MATTLLRRGHVAFVAVGCLVLGLGAQLSASAAAPGTGTWTAVTSPSDGATFVRQSGHEGSMTVQGQASSDVSSVNVYCLVGTGATAESTTVATSVPVASGAFSTTVPVPGEPAFSQCRLRALPSGVNPKTAYVASYAGPVVNLDWWVYLPSSDDFRLHASIGSGSLVAQSLGSCTFAFLGTVLPDESPGGGSDGCALGLGKAESGAQHSTVRVDGHEAFTTTAALAYGLTPPSLASRSFHTWKHTGVRWGETMPVFRCATDVAFPPNASTCPTLVDAGVQILQVTSYFGAGHQVRSRTKLRSDDSRAHVVRLDYTSQAQTPSTGAVGFRFPGQRRFHASTTAETVSRLGSASGTMLVRNDRFSVEGDPGAATRAISWSRTPRSVTFSPTDASVYHTSYRFKVGKIHGVYFGFTDSDGVLTRQAVALGRTAETDMVLRPRVLSPAKGAVVRGTSITVSGQAFAGDNGRPVSVRVNGHAARLTFQNPSLVRFTVTFHEALGRHLLTVVSRDVVGNKRSVQVPVHIVAAH
jgi:hypothetical protein